MASGSGGGSGGATGSGNSKKRKAPLVDHVVVPPPPPRREPRRGLGVAELERIRVELEMAERCYGVPSSSLSAPPPPTALPPAHQLVVQGAAGHHHHHHYVGNGATVPVQLQLPRGYFAPYYLAAQQLYAVNDSFTRLFASNGHPSPHQIQNHHHHHQQVDQIQSAVTALPTMGRAASSESSSSACQQLQATHRPAPGQTTSVPAQQQQVAFVDLVDSDDDGGRAEELDLELRL